MSEIPRLIIGGTQSGVGKSSLTLALVAALRRQNLRVQTFKVGPDYLDPGHLSRASGRPCYNLDGWMCDRAYLSGLFERASAAADIAIIEGVMGLFDGSSADTLQGSTAQIAEWLQTPVLLVVNAHGMARSMAALVQGYANFEPRVKIGGVIANLCGSVSHGQWLRQALAGAQLPPLLGAMPRDALPRLPSRHLGLVSGAETDWNDGLFSALSRAATEHVDLELLLARARRAPELKTKPAEPVERNGSGLRLAVARDAAFQFYYPDLFDALEQRGVELRFFSPLADPGVPAECDALYLGGGYPEVHVEALSGNRAMLRSVHDFCCSGRPVYAECGGLMYLCQGLEESGRHWPLAGILPCRSRMLEKRKALGYVEASLVGDALFGGPGTRLRGHEFHYSELCSDPIGVDGWQSCYQLQQNRSGECRSEGYRKGNVLASYAHLHLASHPRALDCWIERMRAPDDCRVA